MKKLKIWNGRGFTDRKNQKTYSHIYVCAASIKQAIETCIGLGYNGLNYNEVKKYWNEGCWGRPMEGIEQEIGVWAQEHYSDPIIRLI